MMACAKNKEEIIQPESGIRIDDLEKLLPLKRAIGYVEFKGTVKRPPMAGSVGLFEVERDGEVVKLMGTCNHVIMGTSIHELCEAEFYFAGVPAIQNLKLQNHWIAHRWTSYTLDVTFIELTDDAVLYFQNNNAIFLRPAKNQATIGMKVAMIHYGGGEFSFSVR